MRQSSAVASCCELDDLTYVVSQLHLAYSLSRSGLVTPSENPSEIQDILLKTGFGERLNQWTLGTKIGLNRSGLCSRYRLE